MLEAKLWATKSKDPSRKIGAVIVQGRKPVATGYNGFPEQIEDKIEYLQNREFKYPRTIHAEMNAIHNALDHGVKIRGGVLYVFGLPTCSTCAIQVIRAGISRIVFCDLNSQGSQWADKMTIELCQESGVEISEMDKKELDLYEKKVYSFFQQ